VVDLKALHQQSNTVNQSLRETARSNYTNTRGTGGSPVQLQRGELSPML